jgi:serine/threonine protein kinase/Flp pilus assembly protein TadD
MPARPSSEVGGLSVPSWEYDSKVPDRYSGEDSAWVSVQVEAITSAWARGEPVAVEEILEQRPGLKTEDAIRLIYEDLCLRRESGQDVPTAEVVSRFPRWKHELEVLLGCDRLLSRAAIFPEVGEQLGPFRLLSELGRGASGKTYLATEPALADRLVVLKVIPDDQDEHLSLARLQHTHIIPLFSEQTYADRGLRALCMPYLGGTSLSRIFDALDKIPPPQRIGRHLLESLDRAQLGRPSPPSSEDGPYRRYLEQASYVQAICWIGACLADALNEAHVHGLIHMDVKPSNVLIAGDGLPMLLDFHLARKPIKARERVADRLGGTPGWMAPEQEAAMKAVSLGQPSPMAVDQRADIYALGLLLSDALGLPSPSTRDKERRPLPVRNPDVSVGLTDIVSHCLASEPSARYRNATSLADDLRRHLNDLPLRGVANRSVAERWRKWRRRQPVALPRAAAWYLALVALMAAIGLGLAYHRQRLHEIEIDLADGQALRLEHRFPEAVRVLSRGLQRTASLPTTRGLAGLLDGELRLARRGQKAAVLHRLADLVRFRFGLDLPASGEASNLVRDIRAIWREKDLLIESAEGKLDADTEEAIRTDLLELAVVWADLRVRLASTADRDAAKREAIEVLDQAEAACGPSPALTRERRNYAQALGQVNTFSKPEPTPRSAWEHYDLGRSYLRSGALREANAEFQHSLESRPQDFWPNFYQGLCSYRLRQFDVSAAAFRTCIALAPGIAECYFNRGLAEEALGRIELAFRDYSHALELDPGLMPAAINRGILSYNAGRADDAVNDLQRALRSAGSDPQATGRIHYNLALAHLAKGDQPEALASAEAAVQAGYHEARELRDKLRHRRRLLP